jgi:hypothetical protein
VCRGGARERDEDEGAEDTTRIYISSIFDLSIDIDASMMRSMIRSKIEDM